MTELSTDKTIRVLDIKEGTIVDGPGLRTSIYLAGCKHHCQGCHNPSSWDLNGGKEMTISELIEIVQINDFNVTFSGGDPLYQIDSLLPLAAAIKALGYNIWLYTGFTIEEIQSSKSLARILDYVDTIVDGKFIEELKDETLEFRGSSNQRIIYLTKE